MGTPGESLGRESHSTRKRKGHGWLVAVKDSEVKSLRQMRRTPPETAGNVSVPIDGIEWTLRFKKWSQKRGKEYVEVAVNERRWDVSDPDQLRCAIANGLRKSEPGRRWTLRELQQRIGHGVTDDMLRTAISRMERDGWLIVERGKPRKDSLRFALVTP